MDVVEASLLGQDRKGLQSANALTRADLTRSSGHCQAHQSGRIGLAFNAPLRPEGLGLDGPGDAGPQARESMLGGRYEPAGVVRPNESLRQASHLRKVRTFAMLTCRAAPHWP